MKASPSPPLAALEEGGDLRGKRAVALPAVDNEQEANKTVSSRLSPEGSSTAQPLAESAQCYVCRREFRTSKALFGHMRCHPEREWRGVRPLLEGEGSRGRRKWLRVPKQAQTAAGAQAVNVEVEERYGMSLQYACRECTKVFSSRQALGGHRASHRGVLGCSAKAKGTIAAAEGAAAEGGAGAAGEVEKYVCEDCERQFVTYHGMRVHRRIHRDGEGRRRGDASRQGVVAEVTGEKPSGERRRCRMLDLNLPPPPE